MSLVIDLIDLVAKHKAGELRCPATALIDEWTCPSFNDHYHLHDSTFILGESGEIFNFISFFHEIPLSKQNSHRWDVTFCGVTSGAILFACFPRKGCQAYMSKMV